MITVCKLLKIQCSWAGEACQGAGSGQFLACNPLHSLWIVLLLSFHYCWFNENEQIVIFLKDTDNVKKKKKGSLISKYTKHCFLYWIFCISVYMLYICKALLAAALIIKISQVYRYREAVTLRDSPPLPNSDYSCGWKNISFLRVFAIPQAWRQMNRNLVDHLVLDTEFSEEESDLIYIVLNQIILSCMCACHFVSF